jgi:hypothetical protein
MAKMGQQSDEPEPSIIYTAYLSTAEEVVERIEAADVLALGVRVEAREVRDPNHPGTSKGEWKLTLLTGPTVVHEDDK